MKLYRTLLATVLLLTISIMAAAGSLQDNLRRHIERLCSPALMGRAAGSNGEKQAAGYLFDRLEEIGIEMLTDRDGDAFTIVAADSSRIESANIIGILEGEDPDLREEYIVIGAHLDHLGFYSINVDGESQTRIYPGACSNASGIAALIETARILKETPGERRRSIVFVGFGAMEEQFAGSRFFASPDGFSQIGSVKMMINLDMLGRGGKDNPFEIFTSLQPKQIATLVKYVAENESVTEQPAMHNGWVFASDNLAFDQAGIPSLTFSTGTFKEYRTVRDTPDLLLSDNLASQTLYIAAFAQSVSSIETLTGAGNAPEGKVYAMNECDVPPQFFRGGVQSFLENWVYKYLKYPQEAALDGIEGFERVEEEANKLFFQYKLGKHPDVYYKATVYVSLIVEADGNVSNVAIERGVSEALDAEALRVVGASPKWKPGQLDGKKVRTKVVIPVEYRLKKR